MKITSAATVMPVNDVDASIRFYVDVLGFSEQFKFGNYAGVEREGCLIHLSQIGNPNTAAPGCGAVYIFCDDVDAIHQQIVQRGASVEGEPKDYPYGMRDFVACDPDGNKLSFGAPTEKI